MPTTEFDTGMIGRHQRAGDAEILLVTEQAFRVIEPEGEAQQGAHRRQRDVTLVPAHAHADHLAALPVALADDADVGDRGRIRASPGAGQREGRNLLAARQPRQIVVFLLLGAIVQQQFGRAERVRHHHRHRQGRRARRQLGHHLRVRIGREFQPTIALRDDHAEEALALQIIPDLRRQIVELAADAPLIDHGADFLDLVIEEGLLLGAERRLRQAQQPLPIRFAGKQLPFPPDAAGFERRALGVRHRRQQAPIGGENRR